MNYRVETINKNTGETESSLVTVNLQEALNFFEEEKEESNKVKEPLFILFTLELGRYVN